MKGKSCKVLDAVMAGRRYVISADGSYLISARCWYGSKIGNALDSEFILKDSDYLKDIHTDIRINGLPEPCQRLCCAGRIL